MWPGGAWRRLYEPAIRAMAGLGRAPTAPDADNYAQFYAHCDILVIGAGPAGLAAAREAADAGVRVILCDEQAELGGSLLNAAVDSADAAWLGETRAVLADNSRVTCLPRSTAFGIFADNFVAVAQRVTDHLTCPDPALPRERLWQIRAGKIVLAAGAIERPLVFPDNDRPGIMLAGAAQTFVHRYGVLPGSRVVVATAHDDGYAAALALAEAGMKIVAIADARAAADSATAHEAGRAGMNVRVATQISATRGRLRVSAATLRTVKKGADRVSCDLVLMAGGFTPSVHLFSQARGPLRFDAGLNAYIPDGDLPGMICAGACRGIFGADAAREDGQEAGRAALAALRGFTPEPRTPLAIRKAAAPLAAPVHGHAFVDFQNDVTSKDIALAQREGFRSVEHVKRYTTAGMATDQGKTSNMNALGVLAQTEGTSIPDIGLTTFRMPYTPTTFGTLAGAARGDLFDPIRQTPLHGWAAAHGAVFEDVGLWKRARYFPAKHETMDQAVARECRAVRTACGIFDASTLGKIEVVGPDAAVFLERMYVNGFVRLAPGRARYGIMLREDGFIFDDGVIGRIAEDRFHVTTTTGGAARVLASMEDYLQTEWPDLRVWLTSVTEEWATIAVQGPLSRQIVGKLLPDADLSDAGLPHMGLLETEMHGVPVRLFRVSFSGELGYELNIAAGFGRAVWDALYSEGEGFGMTPYGTETMHVLRAEKGYIIVGQETDGTATPGDVGLHWAINSSKGDFIGKRSLARDAMAGPGRKQLVGLLSEDPRLVLEEGAAIVAGRGAGAPVAQLGHVTSSYFSATLGRSIALAMVADARARIGQDLCVPMESATHSVRAVPPVFYDPSGERLHG
jgi:sarcosine oxidase subunit alpha